MELLAQLTRKLDLGKVKLTWRMQCRKHKVTIQGNSFENGQMCEGVLTYLSSNATQGLILC